jgi:hypothetical protein
MIRISPRLSIFQAVADEMINKSDEWSGGKNGEPVCQQLRRKDRCMKKLTG